MVFSFVLRIIIIRGRDFIDEKAFFGKRRAARNPVKNTDLGDIRLGIYLYRSVFYPPNVCILPPPRLLPKECDQRRSTMCICVILLRRTIRRYIYKRYAPHCGESLAR